MYRRGSNNPFISPSGFMNVGSFPAPVGSPEPGGGLRFPGLLGQTVVYDDQAALKVSGPVGTLYHGVYQLVLLSSPVSRGEIVFWDTLANNGLAQFKATHTVLAPAHFKAGVAVCNGLAGEWCWLQVAGLASCLYSAAVTDATIGNLVVTQALNVATVDALADAGAFATAGLMKRLVGQAYEAPAAGNIRRVILNLAGFYQNIG